MEVSISSLILKRLILELKILEGSIVEKIWNPSKNLVVFALHKSGEGKYYLYITKKYLFFKKEKEKMPLTPSNFALFLRKYLLQAKLKKIYQKDYERIVIIEFNKFNEKYFLILELFGKGNIILCDSNFNILVPLEVQDYGIRVIKRGEKYIFPPIEFSFNDIENSNKKDLVRALAYVIGGEYSEYILNKLGINKLKKPSEITQEEKEAIKKEINNLVNSNKVYANGNVSFIKGNISFNSVNEALKYIFEKSNREENKQKINKSFILSKIEEYKSKLEEYQKKAEYLSSNLNTIQYLIDKILNARRSGYSWQQIIDTWKKERESSWEASQIQELTPNYIVFNNIKINYGTDLKELLNSYWEKVKKLKEKIKKAEEYLNKLEIKKEKKKELIKREPEWFEKFRWFITEEGNLVLGGRDAIQNELLIKKYLEGEDLVFHADIYGSPFVIVKKGKYIKNKEDVALFTACFSRAWKLKIPVDVYWIYPWQVSKKAPSGEYILRGAFMVYGKKNYIKINKLELYIGVYNKKLMIGPENAVRKNCKHILRILPGDTKKSDVAKKIREFYLKKGYDFDIDYIIRLLPGECFLYNLTE